MTEKNFEVVYENEEILVRDRDKRKIFQLGSAVLHTADDTEIILSNPKYRSDENIIELESEKGAMQIMLTQSEDCIGMYIEGRVKESLPKFGYQPALPVKDGVRVELLLPEDKEFLSIYQHKEWWIRPAFGKKLSEIPKQSQLLVCRREDIYEIYLAVCGKDNRADLEGSETGIRLSMSSNVANGRFQSDYVMIYTEGKHPYIAIEKAVAAAFKLMGKNTEQRKEKIFPEVFKKLGWCTWDSLGQDVSEKAIFEKMDEFYQKQIPISWVLIDDGWSDSDKEMQKLKGLDADPEKFPKGLEHTIYILKEKYKVDYVGVWQAVKGYWNGILEDSDASRIMGKYLMRYSNGEYCVKPEADAVFGFWNTWHERLKRAGVDFIKVDSQSSFSLMTKGAFSYGKAAQALHAGLEASAALHFKGNLINCMGMAPEDIWNRPAGIVSRNSDDYTPTVSGSFAEHALQNSYNSVYHGCFYWGDWDMVWSRHEDVNRSMLLRAISGGPIYLSDGLNQTDSEKIKPLILDDGTLLRCQDVARPTLDCLMDGEVVAEKPLKIYNRYQDTVYVSVFDLTENDKQMSGKIRRKDIPDELPEKLWVYSWDKKQAKIISAEEELSFTVMPKDAALFHLIPWTENITIIGITDKYLSEACAELILQTEKETVVRTKCRGEFCFLSEQEIKSIRCDGKELAFKRTRYLYSVSCKKAHSVIQIERESA